MAKKEKEKIRHFGWLKILIAIFFVLVVLVFSYAYFYHIVYAQKFYPGFKLGGQNISGKNYLEVFDQISAYTDKTNKDGLIYLYNQEKVAVMPTISAEDSDLTFDIFKFDEKETLNEAYDYGRSGSLAQNFIKHFSALISGVKVPLKYELNETQLEQVLSANFSRFEQPAVDAHLKIKNVGQYEVVPEKAGSVFDYSSLILQTKKQMETLNKDPINLVLVTDHPQIKQSETPAALNQVSSILALAPLTLTYGDKKWEISQKDLEKFIDFKLENGAVTLGFNTEFANYLSGKIGKEIFQPVKEGKFTLKDGQVMEFQDSQPGLAINVPGTVAAAETAVFANKTKSVSLAVSEVLPEVTPETISQLGGVELVGHGESNFKGSPKNRIHNIEVGAAALNGLLVKPGEEFSLVKALGNIDASTGYLQELVIKGNKTVPEYGGGLCQIGTTAFRLALYTGLPISERTNHSYRVSYYEPAGMDATIYDPKPDLVFTNDTGHYLLFQTRIEGTNLIFEFYGTADGRKVDITQPVLSNFVAPPPAKIVETTDLAPGVKKCTEKAHTGATAVFYRTVTSASGKQTKETWSSHYKPWQEVCLVGKAL